MKEHVSFIRCEDDEVLTEVAEFILNQTPSNVVKDSKYSIRCETKGNNLDKQMQEVSKVFSETKFSCTFIVEDNNNRFEITKEYKNGYTEIISFNPIYTYRSIGIGNAIIEGIEDFKARVENFFNRYYIVSQLADGEFLLEYIPNSFFPKNEHFFPQVIAEYENHILTALLSPDTTITLMLEDDDSSKKGDLKPDTSKQEEYYDLPF